jgi:hypothetical protein
MNKEGPRSYPVRCEVAGKTYEGTYTISGGMVHVSSAHGHESTQISGSPPDTMARMVLRELVDKERDRK